MNYFLTFCIVIEKSLLLDPEYETPSSADKFYPYLRISTQSISVPSSILEDTELNQKL